MGFGHVGVGVAEAEVGVAVDDGVFEETAGGAVLFGSWELGPADGGDEVAHLALGGGGDAAALEFVGQGFVFEHGGVFGGEAQVHLEDEVAAGLLFEEGGAVGEAAFLPGEGDAAALVEVEGVDAVDELARFDAVGTGVLHHGAAHGAGDGGEVLDAAAEAAVDAVVDEGVELEAGTCN